MTGPSAVFLGSLPGRRGAIGPQGPAAVDAPSDFFVYGRAPGSWQRVLPLTGDQTPQNLDAGTMTGGISFGSTVAAGWNDRSQHLVFNTNSGINVTSGTQNYVTNASSNYFTFYVSGARSFQFSGTGTMRQWWLGSSGVSQLRFTTTNGQFILAIGMMWTSNANFQTNNLYVVGEITVNDVGVRYFSFNNGISWRWDGSWILTRIDQAVEYPVANACDERLKQDIAPASFDCLAAIKRIRLWQYRWRDRSNPRQFKRTRRSAPLVPLGLVAQRLNADFPEGAARPRSQFGTAVQMWNADSNTMLAALTGAVQQLADRVDAVRARGVG